MVLMAGLELPSRAIREQAVSAIDIIVQVRRYEGWSAASAVGFRIGGYGR